MARGDRLPAEWRTFADDLTGVEVHQLTNHKGHSHHLYFTTSTRASAPTASKSCS